MKIRLLVALAVVLALVLGGGLMASAGEDQPDSCWWFSYTILVTGKPLVKIRNTCIPCFALCDMLPPPPGVGSPGTGVAAVR